MKLLHTADWHLGRMLYGVSLLPDQRRFITESFLPLVDAQRPDAVLLAGDIFDRAVAPAAALELFDYFVTQLCLERKVPLIAVSGNHDSPARLGMGAALLRAANFYMTTNLENATEPICLPGHPGVHIYTLPYFDPAQARERYGEEIRGFSDGYAAAVAEIRAQLDADAKNILVTHCFVAGSSMCESESPLFVGGAAAVEADVFSPFDYVALGHLHSPQGQRIRYAGSPLKYSFDEEKHKKSVTLIEIEDTVTVKQIPVVAPRDLCTVSGTLEELLAGPVREDYVFVNLAGPPVFEPVRRLAGVFPNLLALARVGGQTVGGVDRTALRQQLEKKNDTEIFKAFWAQACGGEPTPEALEVFRAAYREAGGAKDEA